MNEELSKIMQKGWFVPTVVGVVSGAVGFTLGCVLSNHQWRKIKDEMNVLEEEVAKSHFERLELVDEFNRLIQRTSFVTDRLREGGQELLDRVGEVKVVEIKVNDVAIGDMEPEVVEEPLIVNVFEKSDDDWDYELELSTRSPDEPYILHVEEFENDEMQLGHSTLTYYQGDDILTDEKDTPIYNYKVIVGDLKFGHGSQDPSIVYVRNEKLAAEYEILLERGYYQTVVLGEEVAERLDPGDLRHSRHSVPKFRPE
jgi:hypothetical protein